MRFNRNATADKAFIQGDKCLVLEAIDPSEMYARWSEPATVLIQQGLRNYEVKLNDGKVEVFHVNQLRRYNERTEFINAVIVAADTVSNYEEKFLPVIDDEITEPLKFNIEESLPPDQKQNEIFTD
jgi:hypothetical protein